MPTMKGRRPVWDDGTVRYDLKNTIANVYVEGKAELLLWFDILQGVWFIEVRLTDQMARRLNIHKGDNFSLDMGERSIDCTLFQNDWQVEQGDPPIFRNRYPEQEQIDFFMQELRAASSEFRGVRVGLSRISP